jgi:hypothetical protein
MAGRASAVGRAGMVGWVGTVGRRNSSRNRMRRIPFCFYAKSATSTLFISVLRLIAMHDTAYIRYLRIS